MKISFLLSAVVLLSLVSCSRYIDPFGPKGHAEEYVKVHKVDANTNVKFNSGAYYYLPKTVLDVDFKLKKTYRIKGPYAAYASKYLGIENVITSNSTTYDIVDAKINTHPVVDTNQVFFIELPQNSDTFFINPEMKLYFDNGAYVNSRVQPNRQQQEMKISSSVEDYSSTFKYFADDNLFETVDTVIEKVEMDTITIEKTVFKKKIVEKSLEQKAKEAANYIQELKKQRMNLLTGYQEIAYDYETIKYMASELEKIEKEYIELFTGVTREIYVDYHYEYIPETSSNCIPEVLTTFVPTDGMVAPGQKSGINVYLQICSNKSLQGSQNLLNDSVPSYGFYYRAPEYANVKIFLGEKILINKEMPIPQFGPAMQLPEGKYDFEIDPNTGYLLRF